jgi:hypothetical protein
MLSKKKKCRTGGANNHNHVFGLLDGLIRNHPIPYPTPTITFGFYHGTTDGSEQIRVEMKEE